MEGLLLSKYTFSNMSSYATHKRIERLKQQTKSNTMGNFETVTFFIHDIEKRKSKIRNNEATLDKVQILRCSIFVQNLTFQKFVPNFIGLPVLQDFLYS